MSQAELISPLRFIARLPGNLPRLPRMLLGLYYTGIRNREKALSLGWALERAARLYPQRPAVIDEQRRLGYAEFNAWCNRLAHALKAEGVAHGSVVAVMLENRIEVLAVLGALAKLGAIAALVNTTQRGKVLSHSLNLVKSRHFVAGEELRGAFEEVRCELEDARHCYWVADGDSLTDPAEAPPGWRNLMRLALGQPESNPTETARVRLKDPCFYIYTSGTTGLPKASILSHGKWIKAYGGFGHSGLSLTERDVFYLTLPCYHNNAVTVSWASVLAGGATFAIVRYDLENDRPLRNHRGFLQEVAKGEAGLLISEISPKWPFDGYTDPAKSEAVILRDVFKKGDAWFNTGDLMRGIGCKHAQFVDRLGDTFRWKGENVSTTEVENALGAFPGVEDAVVYGVEIPGTNGRCGMAALRLANGAQLDREALAAHLDRELPAYAAPLFVRLLEEVETTGTFKYKKTDLKTQAYDPEAVMAPLFARLPGDQGFQPLDGELYQAIQRGEYRF
ncbi:Long-chain-fatty-acid--CoA ligase FadD13 [compost metagenome]